MTTAAGFVASAEVESNVQISSWSTQRKKETVCIWQNTWNDWRWRNAIREKCRQADRAPSDAKGKMFSNCDTCCTAPRQQCTMGSATPWASLATKGRASQIIAERKETLIVGSYWTFYVFREWAGNKALTPQSINLVWIRNGRREVDLRCSGLETRVFQWEHSGLGLAAQCYSSNKT